MNRLAFTPKSPNNSLNIIMDAIKSKISQKLDGGNSGGNAAGDTNQAGAAGGNQATGMDGKIDQGRCCINCLE